ncbi:type I-B CRISPR-associated protein Cas5b [Desulfonema magnum]|uniref:CRISPR-associated protein Cas5, subtype I-B/TNEAP n=1 Tax=Desulfonema magnum TaxID=45655 RepID=A0A975BY32_9BACT|nr:type I-B CRISPR-associated protein Cas5b [Desulfonema magnum]QTA93740.1 CRISPR-associated protein Cas5, subtype I-B/TNEAP [Desulfonema magnum]
MKAFRIHITSWTASFRYPNLISGYQPSLVVPPLSTVFGLFSAAAGEYVSPEDIATGYVFRFASQAIDIETIYQFNNKSARLSTKSNIIRRQILFDNELWIYVTESRIAEAFAHPHFQMVLGRSGDLACVNRIDEIDLKPVQELARLRGTIVPMGKTPLSAPIHALPIGFTNEIPRRNIGTFPYFLLEYKFRQSRVIPESGFLDEESDHEVFWHDNRR